MNFEQQYAESLKKLLNEGVRCENRTGIDTLSIQHQYFLLENIGTNFPIIKGKKVFPMLALKELMWILNGRSDVKWLQDRDVNYWNEWASDGLGKNAHIPVGTIGKSYGYQMRNFNGCDQLHEMINEMSHNSMSRRLIINLYNPADIKETTLPPCVYDYHFGCVPQTSNIFNVDLHVSARSEDSFLGLPYDFMSAGWFLMIICKIMEMNSTGNYYFPRNIHYTAHDYHLYTNHIEQAKQYLNNVEENKNNVINSQAVVSIGNTMAKNLDDFLQMSDNCKYQNFWINKFYHETYDKIEAEIAI